LFPCSTSSFRISSYLAATYSPNILLMEENAVSAIHLYP
jgi:hypothetical protein